MSKNFLLALVCLAFTACAPSPVELTSTANIARIQTETAAPTAIYTPSPTPTHTPTLAPTVTATPIPTPLGGGDGMLIFSGSPLFKNGILSEPGDLYQVYSDGTDLKQLLSSAQIRTFAGDNYGWAIYNTDHKQNYIITKNDLYIMTDDWRMIKKAGLKYSKSISSTSDWNHILWKDASEYYYLTNGETGTQVTIGPNIVIGLSADTIYYYGDDLRNIYAKNSDGSNFRKLDLAIFENLTNPEETVAGFEWEVALMNSREMNRAGTMLATSPDQSKVAFIWKNFVFTADATDTDFKKPVLLATLPHPAYNIYWSPDGKYILAGLIQCPETFFCMQGDIVLVNTASSEMQAVDLSEFPFSAYACGFSPDSKSIALGLFYYEKPKISLLNLDNNSFIDIETNVWSCPVWR